MADYDTDNPNKLKLDWTNLNTWLIDSKACSGAAKWVQDNISTLKKVKIDIKQKRTYNMDSSIYALEKFIEEKQFIWANWFLAEIMEESEYKSYATFALDQIPKEIDDKNEILIEAINEAQSCAKNAIDNNKPSAARKTIEYVIRVNALFNPYINTDDILVKILNHGISLIKNRKL
jgi:hypothetical protein